MRVLMIPPVRREALRKRAEIDEADERVAFESESLSDRLALALELSGITRALAESVDAPWIREPPDDLPEKARLYAEPLRKTMSKI